jgi:hypothetical protein
MGFGAAGHAQAGGQSFDGPVRKSGGPARRESPLMGRTEYYYDPHAPKANSLIPASNLLVVD